MKKEKERFVLSDDPEIRRKQLIEFAKKVMEEDKELMDRLANDTKPGDDE